MSTQIIYQALRSRLNTLPSAPPIAYENQPYTPQTGTLWLRESFLPATTVPFTVADGGSLDHSGIYQVSVFAPADGGAAEGQLVAESVATHFARGTQIGQGRVQAVSIDTPVVEDGWWMIPVSVRYRAFYDG
jgi:hypothetical protein